MTETAKYTVLEYIIPQRTDQLYINCVYHKTISMKIHLTNIPLRMCRKDLRSPVRCCQRSHRDFRSRCKLEQCVHACRCVRELRSICVYIYTCANLSLKNIFSKTYLGICMQVYICTGLYICIHAIITLHIQIFYFI